MISFKFSHSILNWTAVSWKFWGIFKTFLEGSVDHIIYRDYIANRRSFIYCSLACTHCCSTLHNERSMDSLHTDRHPLSIFSCIHASVVTLLLMHWCVGYSEEAIHTITHRHTDTYTPEPMLAHTFFHTHAHTPAHIHTHLLTRIHAYAHLHSHTKNSHACTHSKYTCL